LGHSYSFWLPWDDAGGPQRRISLICRFDDVSGKGVMSEVARVMLPGTVAPPEEATSADEASQSVRQVSYDSPRDGPQETPRRKPTLQTTTIDVTPGFAAKLLQARREKTGGGESSRESNTTPKATAEDSTGSVGPQGQLQGMPPAPSAHSALEQSPAQNEQAVRPFSELAPRGPRPTRAPSRLPPTPRSNWTRPRTTPTPASGAAQNSLPYGGGTGN
jgi:hypothetical protein